jgi:hypothetical protein
MFAVIRGAFDWNKVNRLTKTEWFVDEVAACVNAQATMTGETFAWANGFLMLTPVKFADATVGYLIEEVL